MASHEARLERESLMDNNIQMKIDWKCSNCGTCNEFTVTRRNIARIDHHLRHKCSDCKAELVVNVLANQEVSKW